MSEKENKDVTVEEQGNEEVESMSAALDASVEIKPGDIVDGVVLTIDEDKNVVVGLETGQEGYIPINELSVNHVTDPSDEVSVDDEIKVTVLRDVSDKEEGSFVLSKKRVDQKQVWDDLQEKFEN